MTSRQIRSLQIFLTCLPLLLSCGGASLQPKEPSKVIEKKEEAPSAEVAPDVAQKKQDPPASGVAREIQFPPITRKVTKNGLEVNTVAIHQLPIVQIQLVIRSGSSSDPQKLPGLSKLTALMLKEGTTRRSSALLAEAIDFLGARLSIHSDQDNIYIQIRALSEHLNKAMSLIAEIAMWPRFSYDEIKKLKKRELNRLALRSQNPNFLAIRALFRRLYGNHPYAHIDTTERVINGLNRVQLVGWHKAHFAPNNAILVVVGDVTNDQVMEAANRSFRPWRKRRIKKPEFPTATDRPATEVILTNRPQSVQSVIYIGNLALPRNHPNYIPLLVANQVLGGSAASRLFMDLREQKGLTYGTYSQILEKRQVAPFLIYAAVRNEVSKEALTALMAHVQAILTQPIPDRELADMKRFLTDSFPLRIDTPSKIADLITDLRVYSLPDDYFNRYRAQIESVTAEQAQRAATDFIKPKNMVISVVGKALAIKDEIATFGPLTIVDTDGKPIPQDKDKPESTVE